MLSVHDIKKDIEILGFKKSLILFPKSANHNCVYGNISENLIYPKQILIVLKFIQPSSFLSVMVINYFLLLLHKQFPEKFVAKKVSVCIFRAVLGISSNNQKIFK